MRRYIQTLCVLAVAVAGLTSCLSDDEEKVTTYSDVAITQFMLGTLNRYTTTTSPTTGNDTLVKTTLTGSSYKMTIDHLGHAIYNQSPLPVGTDVKHVVCTVSTKHNGVLALKSMTSDSLSFFNASDSIDFSVPRVFRVYSIDGTASRDYTVSLNVSQTAGVNFGWTKVDENRTDLTGWTDKRLVAVNDTVVLADRGVVAVSVGSTGYQDLLRLNSDGYTEVSYDHGETWSTIYNLTATSTGLSQLLGATIHEVYGLTADGRLKVSDDALGLYWTDESLDDDARLLPATNIAMVSWPYAPADSTDYVLMVGRQQNDDAFCTWRKLSGYASTAEKAQWVYMPLDDGNRGQLPYGDELSLAYYDGKVIALTASSHTVYVSRDQGITWQQSSDYALPAALQGTRVVMANDRSGRLWVVTDSGEVWLGSIL